ncbi:Ig-like domain-containing protein [Companilactobacillus sp.]|jgi:LPXTG-motif cell wall-anchored protein|uniref:Ig-like domain-containing protein n=1 Tax=Companilactobacillus sp. TaxID=2767905 RepID=UPI0025B81903|nr:Ig-like domain-containing protein [Companilactobacillus sp.]MCH4009096.1 Ig-like domain-containing protein [Companilactobacillus sp.]MCH4050725.1 Ig-like domain-containing protein [Companilactobacillus sp.]MCH4077038.1 Ig-like domain-containing protein [Companilactobacillus sp.]MCH4125614.1 Ig-like domain-containing protein [Companilactobacillus sp.]MCI1311323.1 Ig-like domain-containing protein [Companilactobacillus sp.]
MKKILLSLFATLAAFLFFFVGSTSNASAANITPYVSGVSLSDAVIKDENGTVVPHTAVLPQNEEFTVNYKWSIARGVKTQSGDTFNFQIPDNVKIVADKEFPLTLSNGVRGGTTTVPAGSHVGTVTVNKNFQKYTNRNGFIRIVVYGTEAPPTELAPIVMSKTGAWVDQNDPTTINWAIDVISNGNSLLNPVFTDTMSDNHNYVEGSARLMDSTGNEIPVNVSLNGQTLTFKADGTFVGDLTLTYQSKPSDPTAAGTFENLASYSDDSGNSGSAEASVSRPEIDTGTTEPEPEPNPTPPVVTPPAPEPEPNPEPTEPIEPPTITPAPSPEPGPGTTEPSTPEPEPNPEPTEPIEPPTITPAPSPEPGPGTTEPSTPEPEPNPGPTEPTEPIEPPVITPAPGPGTTEPTEPGNPDTDGSGTEEPGTGSPDTENPGTEEPGTEEPGTGNPDTDENDEESDASGSGTGNPSTDNSNNEGSGSTQPGTDENGTTDSNSSNSSNPATSGSTNDQQVLPNVTGNTSNGTTGTSTISPMNNGGLPIAASSNKFPQTGNSNNKTALVVGVLMLIMAVLGLAVFSRRRTN